MNDTSSYKTRLEEEKSRLEAELQTVGRKNPSNPGDWEAVPQETGQEADPNDRAENLENYSENNAILTDLEIRLGEVNAAMERIEKGGFGACSVCGKEIEADRLEADPAATTCKEHLGS